MKKILIVEGNLREENQSFSEAGIQTHTESLKDSLAYFTDKLETHVVNPSSDENIDKNIDALESYDGHRNFQVHQYFYRYFHLMKD